jgi:hypothetical protein
VKNVGRKVQMGEKAFAIYRDLLLEGMESLGIMFFDHYPYFLSFFVYYCEVGKGVR